MQNYVLGHSNRELRRLMLQADNLRPITTRLLREIGLAQGMRVVDLGCGVGDVAMLAAEMVSVRAAVPLSVTMFCPVPTLASPGIVVLKLFKSKIPPVLATASPRVTRPGHGQHSGPASMPRYPRRGKKPA